MFNCSWYFSCGFIKNDKSNGMFFFLNISHENSSKFGDKNISYSHPFLFIFSIFHHVFHIVSALKLQQKIMIMMEINIKLIINGPRTTYLQCVRIDDTNGGLNISSIVLYLRIRSCGEASLNPLVIPNPFLHYPVSIAMG